MRLFHQAPQAYSFVQIWYFFLFVHRFQRACTKYGVPDVDLFQTTDLWDYKNIALVTQTIFAIGRAVSTTRKLPES